MKPYAGLKFTMFRHNATEDSVKYADQLKQALTDAGLLCVQDRNGTTFSERVIPAGISMGVGQDELGAANHLAEALKGVGLIQDRLPASRNIVRPDAFDIIVAPNR